MSEQELDAILKEIRSRGKSDSVDNNTDTEVPDFDTPKENEVKEAVDNFLVSTNDEKSEDFSLTSTAINSDNNKSEPKPKKKKNNKKAIIITIVAIVLVIAIGVGVYFGFFHKKNTDTPTSPSTTESSVTNSVATDNAIRNPLTGETGYDESALTQRPVAVVVENEYSTESVRPQWALSDADIVLEGESEYSTRLLLFWADYNKVPAQVGPTRSARPPFIRFSQLFDSVFIHAGLSKSKGDYVGADTVFTSENVDHINLLQLSSDSTYFSRDKSRTSTIEHTGYLNGTNLAKLLEQKNIDTTLNEAKFTSLNFNSEAQALSTENASTVKFTWSSSSAGGRCPKVGTFTYDESTHKYTTTDFDSKYGESGVQWENLIFLLDETQYVVKDNYKGSGNSETYCNYSLSGGEGKVVSEGTAVDIKWGVENGKLWMKNAQTDEEILLNVGKSYIGYGSSNHGGSITINPAE